MRHGSVRALALFVLLLAKASLADTETESVRLIYAGVDDCPNSAAFKREVRARTPKASFSDASEGRTFDVKLERSKHGFSGELAIVERDGARSTRRLDGELCEEVVSALALVAALAVDPEASSAPRSELGLPSAPSIGEPAREPEREPQREPERAPAPPPSAARLSLRAGISAGVVQGPAPEPLIAAAPEFELARVDADWRPSLRIAFVAAETGIVGPEAELASFRLLAARIELCPHALALSRKLSMSACLLGDVGALRARGEAAPEPGAATRPWATLGLGLGLAYAITGGIYLRLSAAEAANLTRDDFVFLDPHVLVHDVPVASSSLFLGVGFELL
jgi:hypothetical protein